MGSPCASQDAEEVRGQLWSFPEGKLGARKGNEESSAADRVTQSGFHSSSTAQEPFDHGHITCHLSEPQLPCL